MGTAASVATCFGVVCVTMTSFNLLEHLYERVIGYDPECGHHQRARGNRFVRYSNALVFLLNYSLGTSFFCLKPDSLSKYLESETKKTGSKLPDCLIEQTNLKSQMLSHLVKPNPSGPHISLWGQFSMVGEMKAKIRSFFALKQYLAENAQVLQGEFDSSRMVIIAGLPRTGSTVLHHLLSLDKNNRTFRMWESNSPVPPPERETYDTDPRIKRDQTLRKIADFLYPGLHEAVYESHVGGQNLPEECLSLFALVGFQAVYYYTVNDGPYRDWVCKNESGLREVLEWHKICVRVLTEKFSPAGKIVVKCPAYSFALKQIKQVYPQAKLIFTHREASKVAPSVAKVLHPVNSIQYAYLDLHMEGENALKSLDVMTNQLLQDRAQLNMPLIPLGDHQSPEYVDISMDKLVKEPIRVIEEIYSAFSMGELSVEYRQAMQAYLQESKKKVQIGVDGTQYAAQLPETWGWTKEQLQAKFASYASFIAPLNSKNK